MIDYTAAMTPKDHKLAAVVFTDVVGFSRMMETDEVGTISFLGHHHDLITKLTGIHRGHLIKTIGDAFLMDFPTAMNAVACSVAIQEGMGQYNKANGKFIALRIGVHLGDIYFYENDALGEGINIASRLQSLSQPGTITISREVYNQVSGKISLRIESLGQVPLKNITREVHAYRILTDTSPTGSNTEASPPISDLVPGTAGGEPFRALPGKGRKPRKQRPEKSAADLGLDWFTLYKVKTLDKIEHKTRGWWGHFFSFLGVNALLHFVSLQTAEYHWAVVTSLAWGIGLARHFVSLTTGRKTKKMLEATENLEETEGKELKRVIESHQGLLTRLVTSVAISVLLIYLQGVTTGTGDFPWGWVATGFVLLSTFGRIRSWLALGQLRRKWKERLKRVQPAVTLRAADNEVPVRARELEAAIRRTLAGIKDKSLPWAKDLIPTLDQYMVQIGKLVRAERDVSRVLDDLALDDLGGQEEKFQRRLHQAKSDSLRQECSHALDTIRKQKSSQEDLEEQRELITMKIDGALQTLKQIHLDLTRIHSHGGVEGSENLRLLQKRSDDLGNDLLDYASSWQEIEAGR